MHHQQGKQKPLWKPSRQAGEAARNLFVNQTDRTDAEAEIMQAILEARHMPRGCYVSRKTMARRCELLRGSAKPGPIGFRNAVLKDLAHRPRGTAIMRDWSNMWDNVALGR